MGQRQATPAGSPPAGPPCEPPPGSGRDGRSRKRDAILAAARDLFLANGFAATSIDAIATTAGVSRQTIYNNFASKEALLGALADDLAARIVEPLLVEAADAADLERTLLALAERALTLIVEPSAVTLHRLVVCEAPHFPDLAGRLYASGAGRAAGRLSAYLAGQAARGNLAVDDPDLAAEHFFGMIAGHRQLRALLGVPEPAGRTLPERAARTVAAFLRAYRA